MTYVGEVIRDAQATREAILAAAAGEFSEHGFAGARIERIAAASGRNRAMIYAYFGSKEGLLGAVFDQLVTATTAAVPLDASDLPGYAVRLFDQHRRHPQAVRLAAWDRLERDAAGLEADLVRETNAAKVRAIEAEQVAGRVSDRIPADQLLDVVVALSRLQGREPTASPSDEDVALRRAAVHAAVAAIVHP